MSKVCLNLDVSRHLLVYRHIWIWINLRHPFMDGEREYIRACLIQRNCVGFFVGFGSIGLFPINVVWFIGLQSFGIPTKDSVALCFGGKFSFTPTSFYNSFGFK
jgi:hypothetical protein